MRLWPSLSYVLSLLLPLSYTSSLSYVLSLIRPPSYTSNSLSVYVPSAAVSPTLSANYILVSSTHRLTIPDPATVIKIIIYANPSICTTDFVLPCFVISFTLFFYRATLSPQRPGRMSCGVSKRQTYLQLTLLSFGSLKSWANTNKTVTTKQCNVEFNLFLAMMTTTTTTLLASSCLYVACHLLQM